MIKIGHTVLQVSAEWSCALLILFCRAMQALCTLLEVRAEHEGNVHEQMVRNGASCIWINFSQYIGCELPGVQGIDHSHTCVCGHIFKVVQS